MGNKIVLLGGGGHCNSVVDTLLKLNQYENILVLDPENVQVIGGIEVKHDDNILGELKDRGYDYAFITVGSVGDCTVRRKLADMTRNLGYVFPVIIDPSATVSDYSDIGEGTFIGKNAVVNAGSTIGKMCIINSGAIVEHDCTLKDYVHVSPGAVLCGGVCVGEETHIGAGSVVRELRKIGEKTLIGAGSVVVKDISSNVIAVGNPAEIIKRLHSKGESKEN